MTGQSNHFKINVTQEHIDHGRRGLPWACPIALAIKEATNYLQVLWTGTEGVLDLSRSWVKPASVMRQLQRIKAVGDGAVLAHNFVMDFDKGEPVEPFTFEIEEVGQVWQR